MVDHQLTILHLVYSLTVGGAERVLVNVVNHTCDKYRHIVCSFTTVDDVFAAQINNQQVDIVCLNKRSGNDFSLPGRIADICNKYSVDIIHAQGWGTYAEGVAGAILSRCKPAFIFAFRGKTLDDLAGIKYRRKVAQKILSYYCRSILTPSLQMADEYSESVGVSRNKMITIYNGVDTELYCPPADKAVAKRAIGLSESTRVIGCVARFDPVKNLQGLVSAFSRVAENHTDCALLLVGDGETKNDINKMVTDLDLREKVLMPGATIDVARYFQAMDVYVQPSFYEGISNTILEAMGTGLPIVAGAFGGTPETVKNHENGLLLDAVSPDLLYNALDTLLMKPGLIGKFGDNSRQEVLSRFSLKSMIAGYEHLFDQVKK